MIALSKQLDYFIAHAITVRLVLCPIYYFACCDRLFVWALFVLAPVNTFLYACFALFGYSVQRTNHNSIFTIIKLSLLVFVILFFALYSVYFIRDDKNKLLAWIFYLTIRFEPVRHRFNGSTITPSF